MTKKQWIWLVITSIGLIGIHIHTQKSTVFDDLGMGGDMCCIMHMSPYVKTIYIDKKEQSETTKTPLYVLNDRFHRFEDNYYIKFQQYTLDDLDRLQKEQNLNNFDNSEFRFKDYARFQYFDFDSQAVQRIRSPNQTNSGFLKFQDKNTLHYFCTTSKETGGAFLDIESRLHGHSNPTAPCNLKNCESDFQSYCIQQEKNDDFLK